jgi:hypothetical protein
VNFDLRKSDRRMQAKYANAEKTELVRDRRSIHRAWHHTLWRRRHDKAGIQGDELRFGRLADDTGVNP